MLKKLHFQAVTLLFVSFLAFHESKAQFSLIGQVRTRTEYRNGLGNLKPLDAKPAFFTSQRTRLSFGYKWDRVLFQVAAQDVRVWGQDASSISNADGNKLMIHEAWAEVTLANRNDTTIRFAPVENLSLKIGRQELVYDDVRLLGNLDWLQQARRHDAALLKMQHQGWQLDLGAGFNQNTDAFGTYGTNYTAANVPAYVTDSKGNLVNIPAGFIPTTGKGGAPRFVNPPSTNGMNQMYKSMQMLYVSKKFGQTKVSGLFFKDDFSKYRLDSIKSSAGESIYGRRFDQTGVSSRLTYGLMVNKTMGNASGFKVNLVAAAYFQSGKNKDGKDLKASHYTAALTLQKGKFSFGPGWDYLSGNESVGGVSTSTTDNRFDPLYGTPHKFWGYMDYFYVGTGSPVGGLSNAYLKTKYTAKDFFLTVDYHYFMLAKSASTKPTDVGGATKLDNYMGSEVDIIANYNLNKFANLEAGFCFLKGNNTLEYAKTTTLDKTEKNASWAYLMINIRPDFFFAKPVAIKQ